MLDNKKQIVSLRMNGSDLRKVKDLAFRLRVRESDILRFAIRSTLRRLAPLHDTEAKGSDLIPVLIEFGPELMRQFELDTLQLEALVNAGILDPEKRVERSDIELLAMAGLQDSYVYMKLKSAGNSLQEPPQDLSLLLKQYMLEKYVNRADSRSSDSDGAFLHQSMDR